MTEASGHHLFLRDEEVEIILEALVQYEPADADGRYRRGKIEQLTRLIQRGTGIPDGFVRRADPTPARTRLDAPE